MDVEWVGGYYVGTMWALGGYLVGTGSAVHALKGTRLVQGRLFMQLGPLPVCCCMAAVP